MSVILTAFWWAYRAVPGSRRAAGPGARPRRTLALAGLWWSCSPPHPVRCGVPGVRVIRAFARDGPGADWPASGVTCTAGSRRASSPGPPLLLCGLYLGNLSAPRWSSGSSPSFGWHQSSTSSPCWAPCSPGCGGGWCATSRASTRASRDESPTSSPAARWAKWKAPGHAAMACVLRLRAVSGGRAQYACLLLIQGSSSPGCPPPGGGAPGSRSSRWASSARCPGWPFFAGGRVRHRHAERRLVRHWPARCGWPPSGTWPPPRSWCSER